MFGQDADNETALFRLSGWMRNHPKFGRGVGFILASGTVILGSTSIDVAPVSGVGLDAGPWFEIDTYTLTTNACQAAAYTNGANSSTILVMPTLGYTDILCEVHTKDGTTGVESMDLTVLYRQVPEDMAYRMLEILE
jgi:hypothetical protein